jgi:hypothetical protein
MTDSIRLTTYTIIYEINKSICFGIDTVKMTLDAKNKNCSVIDIYTKDEKIRDEFMGLFKIYKFPLKLLKKRLNGIEYENVISTIKIMNRNYINVANSYKNCKTNIFIDGDREWIFRDTT